LSVDRCGFVLFEFKENCYSIITNLSLVSLFLDYDFQISHFELDWNHRATKPDAQGRFQVQFLPTFEVSRQHCG